MIGTNQTRTKCSCSEADGSLIIIIRRHWQQRRRQRRRNCCCVANYLMSTLLSRRRSLLLLLPLLLPLPSPLLLLLFFQYHPDTTPQQLRENSLAAPTESTSDSVPIGLIGSQHELFARLTSSSGSGAGSSPRASSLMQLTKYLPAVVVVVVRI